LKPSQILESIRQENVIKSLEYEINCLAMSIVNYTNETNSIDVYTRQKTNDHCTDYAVNKIKEFLNNFINK
jgi:hypothetical protein